MLCQKKEYKMVQIPLNSEDIYQTRHTSNIYQSEKVQSSSAPQNIIIVFDANVMVTTVIIILETNSLNQVRWIGSVIQ